MHLLPNVFADHCILSSAIHLHSLILECEKTRIWLLFPKIIGKELLNIK